MRTVRTVAAMVAVMSVAVACWGQTPAPAAGAPESVLKHIPAGAMGYVIVSDVKRTCDQVDAYLDAIGVRQLLGPQYTGALNMLKGLAQLGDGFNPAGGFAVVMLDPQQFGFDLSNPEPDKMPLVFLVPATTIADLFSAYKMTPDGQYTRVALRMGEVSAAQAGGYVVFGFSQPAVDAVLKVKTTADTELGKEQTRLIGQAALAYRINMKITGPFVIKAAEQLADVMAVSGEGAAGAAQFKQALPVYRALLAQLDSVTFGIRMGEKATVAELLVDPAENSTLARVIAAQTGTDKPSLDLLPNLSYVMAFGRWNTYSKDIDDLVRQMIEAMKTEKVTPEQIAKIEELATAATQQITVAQAVIGAAPAGNGVMGVAVAIKCKDSAKLMSLVSQYVPLMDQLNEAQGLKMKLAYQQGAEQVDGLKADAVVIDIPQLGEKEREQLKPMMGEQPLRLLIAPADGTTVVASLGGGTAMLSLAAKTATKGGGTIGAGDAEKAAMKEMPPRLVGYGLVNVGNLMDLIANAGKALGAPIPVPPITAKTPIALGVGTAGSTVDGVLYVPNDLVKDIVQAVSGGGQTPPGPPAE